MSNLTKIIILVIIVLLILALVLFFIRTNQANNLETISKIYQERNNNEQLRSVLEEYKLVKNEYHVLDAVYQKCLMELPDESSVTILTSEIYDIAKYAEVDIQTIDFSEIDTSGEENGEEVSIGIIEVSILFEGSYYQILNFINMIEILPRITRIKTVSIDGSGEDIEKIPTFINAETYYQKG